MLLAFIAKNKMGFIDDSIPQPATTNDLLYGAWNLCNSMVNSWILNLVAREIVASLLYISTTTETVGTAWENSFIKPMLHKFSKHKILWDEMKEFQPILILMMNPLPPITKVFTLVVQEERQRLVNQEIMKGYLCLPTTQEIWRALSKAFYDGSDELQVFSLNQKAFTAKQSGRLDGNIEQVRGEILRKDPLPDLEECYALIQREAVRHTSMKAEFDNLDTSSMVDWWDQIVINERRIPRKTSTAAVAEIKIEVNVAEKASALVAAIDYGDRSHLLDLPHKKLFPQPMDIQTRLTIGCGIKRGKLYYLDLQSKDSNKLRQALMIDGSEGEKKNLKFDCGINVWDMLHLVI
ncbi:hypothetical protein CK203_055169 [Vitis vinifera]|uniref:Uncharacterized protein n=1 Tax=Vitis vinifera TaxID=29760 RepID=A0A438GMW3_VITVI|nr:hypothetical protein CK203_055169 [Vitis vinifera]